MELAPTPVGDVVEHVRHGDPLAIDERGRLGEAQVLQRVGKPLGVQEQKDLSKKDRQQAARLVALSGAQFDDEYIKFMLKDQKQDLKRFDGETQLALDPGVKIAAEYGKKLISQHLESIERIAEGRSLVADNQKATIGGK